MPVAVGHFAAAVAAVFGVLLLGLVSRVSIALGGFATADFLVCNRSVLGPDAIDRRMRAAELRLAGLILALGLVAAGSGWWLATYGGPADRLVAGLVGICLMLRSRLFDQTRAGIGLAVAGAICLGLAIYRLLADRPTGWLWLTPLAVAVAFGALLAVFKGLSAGGMPGGAARQLLYWGETTAMIAMICALATPERFLP
jgi:hypothetical protein